MSFFCKCPACVQHYIVSPSTKKFLIDIRFPFLHHFLTLTCNHIGVKWINDMMIKRSKSGSQIDPENLKLINVSVVNQLLMLIIIILILFWYFYYLGITFYSYFSDIYWNNGSRIHDGRPFATLMSKYFTRNEEDKDW